MTPRQLYLLDPVAPIVEYRTVLADPPWPFADKLRMSTVKRSAQDHYPTMTVTDIGALGYYDTIAGIPIAADGFLWLWTTATHLLSGEACWVAEQWGYHPKQIVPWIKGRVSGTTGNQLPHLILNTGMGRITRGVSEYLLVCTRGKYSTLVKSHSEHGLILDDIILAPRGPHSVKPAEQYLKIERLCPGPYLELFAREKREGWTSVGDALGITMSAQEGIGHLDEEVLPDPGLEWNF